MKGKIIQAVQLFKDAAKIKKFFFRNLTNRVFR